jgi:hypothetical protein
MIDSRLFCLVLTRLHTQVWSVVYLSQWPAEGAAQLTFCARYMGYIKSVVFFVFVNTVVKNVNLTLFHIIGCIFDTFSDRYAPFQLSVGLETTTVLAIMARQYFSTVLGRSTFRQFYCMFLCAFISIVLLHVLCAYKSDNKNRHSL